VAKLRAMIHI